MNEPLIRVVKKAELGSRETFILRLEAILLALVAGGLFDPDNRTESICHYKHYYRSSQKRDGHPGDGENCDSGC